MGLIIFITPFRIADCKPLPLRRRKHRSRLLRQLCRAKKRPRSHPRPKASTPTRHTAKIGSGNATGGGCGAANSGATREDGDRFRAVQTGGGQNIENCAIASKSNRAEARFFATSDRNAAPGPPAQHHLRARPQQRAIPNAQFSNNWPPLRIHTYLRSDAQAGKKPQAPINDATGPVKPAKEHHCPRAANRAQGYNSVANH